MKDHRHVAIEVNLQERCRVVPVYKHPVFQESSPKKVGRVNHNEEFLLFLEKL